MPPPQDEEELEWLAVAKKGDGVKKSEKRRESAETEYFRLLCDESMQQVRSFPSPRTGRYTRAIWSDSSDAGETASKQDADEVGALEPNVTGVSRPGVIYS